MRKNIGWLAGIFICFMTFLAADTDEGVKFRDDSWAEVKHDAHSQHKMIFVLVGTTHCNITRRMREDVFTDEDVAKFFNGHFINYWMDADLTANNIRANIWGVKAVPTFVFLDQDQKVVYKSTGFADTDQIIEEAKKAMSEAGEE